MYKNCFECRCIKIKNQRGRHSFYCPELTKILGKYFFIDNMGHRPKVCPLLKNNKKGGCKLMDMARYERLIKDYFVNKCVTTKITGESNVTCKVELVIDTDDIYLKTSFTAIKAIVSKWDEENDYKS